MLTIFQINNTHPSFWFLEFRNTHNRTHINSDPENHILDDPEMSSKTFRACAFDCNSYRSSWSLSTECWSWWELLNVIKCHPLVGSISLSQSY